MKDIIARADVLRRIAAIEHELGAYADALRYRRRTPDRPSGDGRPGRSWPGPSLAAGAAATALGRFPQRAITAIWKRHRRSARE